MTLDLTRRDFLKGLLAAATTAAVARGVEAEALAVIEDESLSFAERMRRALMAAFPDLDADRVNVSEGGMRIFWTDGSLINGCWWDDHACELAEREGGDEAVVAYWMGMFTTHQRMIEETRDRKRDMKAAGEVPYHQRRRFPSVVVTNGKPPPNAWEDDA